MSYREPEDKTWIVVMTGRYHSMLLMTHTEALEYARTKACEHQTTTYVCKVERAYTVEIVAKDLPL